MQVDGQEEWGLAWTAAVQHNAVHRSQLQALGISRGSVAHRLSIGTLHAVFPRVFAVGQPALGSLGYEIAALLSAGEDCVLSHASAAALWGFLPPTPGGVHVTRICRGARQPPGIRIHRVKDIDQRDVRIRYGIPLTAPARTMIDVAGSRSGAEVERALAEARVLGLIDDREIEAAMARTPTRAGVRWLRELMRGEQEPTITRSDIERELRALVKRAELPTPRFNLKLQGFLVDAVWEAAKLVVEVDGYRYHGHRAAFERDRRRDQVLTAAGYRVIRVTWRQLESEPVAVAVRIGQALARQISAG